MIKILRPENALMVRDSPAAIVPADFKVKGIPTLLVKTTKEPILTAEVNQGFSIYVAPVKIRKINTFGLILAFFDDADKPLFIPTPLFNDLITPRYFEIISSRTINVYFLDEHCRMLLGYTATVTFPPESEKALKNANFLPTELSQEFRNKLVPEFRDKMGVWFGQRGQDDDKVAISVSFDKPLILEDICTRDLRPKEQSYHGAGSTSHTTLIRDKPGPSQERDIALLLQKTFKPEYIYLNPFKTTDLKEIVDILVCTPENILLIQAKDSPNTKAILKNALTRKKATALKSLDKAVKQTRGAMRYIRVKTHIDMILENKEYHLKIGDRKIRALIIVKELFDDELAEYSSELNSLADFAPCIVLDYVELLSYTNIFDDEVSFFEAYDTIYDYRIRHGEFPRLRIS